MSDSDFYEKVYSVVERIPYGKVTTYGAIARTIGLVSSARMVGYALQRTAGKEDSLPAHRVVNRLGELTGHHSFPGDTMRERLIQEGIAFTETYRVDLTRHFWNPSEG
ncbi:MAG: MGMT family protein [Balneolaceae bacterium]